VNRLQDKRGLGFITYIQVLSTVSGKQVLIRWNEGGIDTPTWEDVATIKDQFPDFNLEDKVVSVEGSNVR